MGHVFEALVFLSLAQTAPVSTDQLSESSASSTSLEQITDSDKQDDSSIVVYGYRSRDSQNALEACLARNCPPKEDIALTIAYANDLFLDGDYRQARNAVKKSLKRNRRYTEELPGEVGDLFRANSNLARHLGEGEEEKRTTRRVRDIYDNHLPAGDERRFFAKIALADQRLQAGRSKQALALYGSAQRLAKGADNEDLAAFAHIRELSLRKFIAQSRSQKAELRRIRTALQAYVDQSESTYNLGNAARSLIFQINDFLGDQGDKAFAFLDSDNSAPAAVMPVLLEHDPVNIADIFPTAGGNLLGGVAGPGVGSSSITFSDKWADIGYRINSDGSVSDITVLRTGGDDHWVKYMTQSIATRLFAPIPDDENGQPQAGYSVERYTFTSRFDRISRQSGTRVRQRSNIPRIERTDLAYQLIEAAE